MNFLFISLFFYFIFIFAENYLRLRPEVFFNYKWKLAAIKLCINLNRISGQCNEYFDVFKWESLACELSEISTNLIILFTALYLFTVTLLTMED